MSSNNRVRVTVQALTGRKYTCDLKPKNTVADLKRAIADQGIPETKQKLVLHSKELLDATTIEDCQLTPNSTIKLLPSMTSGPKYPQMDDDHIEHMFQLFLDASEDDVGDFIDDLTTTNTDDGTKSPSSNPQQLIDNRRNSFVYVYVPKNTDSTSMKAFEVKITTTSVSDESCIEELLKPSVTPCPRTQKENDKTKTTMGKLRNAINEQKLLKTQHRSNRLKAVKSVPVSCSCPKRNEQKRKSFNGNNHGHTAKRRTSINDPPTKFDDRLPRMVVFPKQVHGHYKCDDVCTGVRQCRSTYELNNNQRLIEIKQPTTSISEALKCQECKILFQNHPDRTMYVCRCGNLYCCKHIKPEQHDCDSSYSSSSNDSE